MRGHEVKKRHLGEPRVYAIAHKGEYHLQVVSVATSSDAAAATVASRRETIAKDAAMLKFSNIEVLGTITEYAAAVSAVEQPSMLATKGSSEANWLKACCVIRWLSSKNSAKANAWLDHQK